MSKRTRDAVILVVLAAVLLGVILLVNRNVPNTTAGIQDRLTQVAPPK